MVLSCAVQLIMVFKKNVAFNNRLLNDLNVLAIYLLENRILIVNDMKIIKLLPAVLIILIASSTILAKTEPAENETVKWLTIEEAQELTKVNPKSIFIDFTAEWCGWCKVMDKKTFSDPEVAAYINENYYAVKVDFESKEKFEYLGEKYNGKELARKYGITGLPTILFASSDFNKIKPVVGYQNVDQFMNKLEKFKDL